MILWLGNVQFVEAAEGNSEVKDAGVTNYIAHLLEVPPEMVNKALVSRTIETSRGGRRGSVYDVPLNMAQAQSTRNGLAKAIYDRLFDWIVMRVNQAMQARAEAKYVIGVLDIYGFEIFEQNSFEQLCINYVNEKLQQIFIELTLKAEQEEYVRERIKWEPINYFNNKVVCDLIEAKRPPGVFAAMNDACATAHADPKAADQSLSQRLGACSHSKHFELFDGNFVVKHYAGDVRYAISGMTDKNKDQLLRDHLELCKSSGSQFMQGLFPEDLAQDSKKRPPTASDRIKHSANELVTKLMQSQPSYIRTIKPNENKSPSEFNDERVLHQVKYLGLCENIRVRRAGFAYRQTFDKFVERFYLLSPRTSYAGDFIWTGDSKSACVQILKDTGIESDGWQMGTTKVFIRLPEIIWGLETEREQYWHNMAQRIQASWRKYMAFKNRKASTIQRAWRTKRQAFELVKFREKGDELLGGNKERRSFSVCGLRAFNGDYLGVNSRNKQTRGHLVREAAAISSEQAMFSSRIDLLVPRSMRSAIPMPRQLVVTKDHLSIVEERLVDGLLQHVLAGKTPVASIRDLAMSPYQDGWIVIHYESQPDLVFNCEFKTELLTWLNMASQGRIRLQASPTISYRNKNMKATQLKFVKNEAAKRTTFTKKTVEICSGLPAGTRSKTARDRPSGAPRQQVRAQPQQTNGYQQPQQQQQRVDPVAAPRPGNARANSNGNGNAAGRLPVPPPPPPPPAAAPQHPRHKALFDFTDANAGMIPLEAGRIYTILERNDTGWWLGSHNGAEGWIPSNYLNPEPEPEAPPRNAVLPRPPAMRNGAGGGAGDAAAGNGQANSMAQLAAALASRSPNGGTPHESVHAPPRPAAANRYAQDDSDDEEAWE
ncbi:class II myosin [Coemansia spiralis]|nr:class II myosin [Coemansia spiralis]